MNRLEKGAFGAATPAVEMISSPRQTGKTSAMWEHLVRTAREFEEAAERDKLFLVCHTDEYERCKAALDDTLARIWAPRRVELYGSDHVARGAILAFENRYLHDVLHGGVQRAAPDWGKLPRLLGDECDGAHGGGHVWTVYGFEKRGYWLWYCQPCWIKAWKAGE